MPSERTCHGVPDLLPDSIAASGRSAEKLSLPTLQSKMKCDPQGYESELVLLYRHFDSSLHLFQQQAALNITSVGGGGSCGDPSVAKNLGDMAMFLSHVTPFYPKHLMDFPKKLADLLRTAARALPSSLRCQLAQALILLINRKIVDIGDNLALFMELQTLGDRALKKLAFSHVIHSIKLMNQKHKNETNNRALQNILYSMLQEENESKAKRALVVLCDLHRRRVWFDDRTANALCTACFHPSSRIMISALSFLLGCDRNEDGDDSEASSSEDDTTPRKSVVISREAVYKAHHKGTLASKKKKQAKLQRAVRSMKRQQRISSEKTISSHYSPLDHLKDPQGFAEKLFSRLQTCNERFEVKMMLLKVIARTVGLHRLVLLNFYPYLQRYVQPHQRDVTELLAAAVQACHDMVPPDAVEPLFKQVVNQFVNDRSRTEAMAVGLNVVREICLRMPLLMTEDLLQDLVLYKKSREKAVSTAARSLLVLFREICPSLLVKKDRGRPTNPKARPKAFGEVNVGTGVPGVELLQLDDNNNSDADDSVSLSSDNEKDAATDDELDQSLSMDAESLSEEENVEKMEVDGPDKLSSDNGVCDEEEEESEGFDDSDNDVEEEDGEDGQDSDASDIENEERKEGKLNSKTRKRKFPGADGQLSAAEETLNRLAGGKKESDPLDLPDGILSNDDFQRIKILKANTEAKAALTRHGLLGKGADAKSASTKILNSEELSLKRVDPAKLEANIRKRVSKEEKLAAIKAGREERGEYKSRAAVKRNKTGGLSNRQKEHNKSMPLVAKRKRMARSRHEKKQKQKRAGKQFRGKKAWK